ncbi:MAG TPA: ABC transporter substrate-binding protein [Polyangiaceae bacterium]|nr:ABC transporter substrate-binding protein [Polyangiaceae bacterium]
MRIFSETKRAWRLLTPGTSLLVAAATLGCLESEEPVQQQGIRLGALLPYTGELAASGHSLEQGVTLAVERVNRAGGVAGQPLVLDFQDTHSDLVRGHASAERLLARGVSAILGPEEPALARELAPLLRERGTVMVSGGISARAEPGSEPSLWLRIFPSAKTVTTELAERMRSDGIGTASLLYVDDSYGTTFAALLAEKFRGLGGTVKDSLPMPRDTSGPIHFPNGAADAVVLVAYPRAGALAVSQLSAGGFDGRWYFGPSLDTDEFLLNTPAGLLENMVGISPALTADSAEFAEQFRARWSGEAPILGANFYYDSAAVLALALQEAHTRLGRLPDERELAVSIRSVSGPPGRTVAWHELDIGLDTLASGSRVNYRGISGPIDFDQDGDVAQGLVRFWHVEHGRIVRE